MRPLKSLSRSAAKISQGDLDRTVDVRSPGGDRTVRRCIQSDGGGEFREFRRLDHEKLACTPSKPTQLAIDSLPDAVFLIRPEGVVEMSNRTAREHFAIHPGSCVADLQLDWLTKLFGTVREEHKPFDPEGYRSAIQIFDGGRERFLLPPTVPCWRATAETIGITVVLVDVTRLRHADELKSEYSPPFRTTASSASSLQFAWHLGLLTGEKLGGLKRTAEETACRRAG